MRWDADARIRALAARTIPVKRLGQLMNIMTMQAVTLVRPLPVAKMANAGSRLAITVGHS
jgi:hypothetical protein